MNTLKVSHPSIKKSILLALFIVIAFSWATKSHADTSATITVTVSDFAFTPSTISLSEGDTIEFVYDGTGSAHNAVSTDPAIAFRCANGCDGDGAGGDGNPSSSAWTSSVTFGTGTAGTYSLTSENFPAMTGTIIIAGAPTAVSISGSATQPAFNGFLTLGLVLFGLLLSAAGVIFALRTRE